jgi:rod shape-determining protein MreD
VGNKEKYINVWTVGMFAFILLYILQTTLADIIEIGGIKPDFMICALVCLTMMHGDMAGAVFGTVCGILLGLGTGHDYAYTVVLCIFGAVLGFLSRIYLRLSLFNMAVVSGAFSVLINIVIFFFTYGLMGQSGFFFALWRVILPEAVYTIAVSPIIYLIFFRIKVLRPIEE